MDALVKDWDEKYKKAWKEGGRDGLRASKIADGECARLPQVLAKIGHTSTWQRGERVIDVAKTPRPGTVIANFVFEGEKGKYPNRHRWHAALFVRGESDNLTTGKPNKIIMFDQWKSQNTSKAPSRRTVHVWPIARGKDPCDKADDFQVVVVQ